MLETQYYMNDIPQLLADKNKEKYRNLLEQILLRLATNYRALEESEYKKFMDSIFKEIGKNQNETFNRDKFEELRMMTNMGANRSK